MKRAICTALLLALALSLCAGAKKPKAIKRPAWVDDPAKEYRQDKYLSAVGTGTGKAEAEKQATAKLAAIVNADEDPFGDFSTEPQPLDPGLVSGGYGKSWKDERSVFHVIAWLDKTATATLYQQRLADNNSLVMERLKAVLQISDPWQYHAVLSAAGRIDSQSGALLRQLEVISPKARAAFRPSYDAEVLSFQIADAARKLQFRLDFTSPEAEALRPSLQAVITEQGFTLDPLGQNLLSIGLTLQSTETSQAQKTVSYTLELAVTDHGQKLFDYSDSGKETAATETEARSRAVESAAARLERAFRRALREYIDALGQL